MVQIFLWVTALPDADKWNQSWDVIPSSSADSCV